MFIDRKTQYFFFWLHHTTCGILVPRPGIDSGPSAVKAQSPSHWTAREFPERLNIIRMPVFPNLIYRFNAILIKIPVSYFEDIDKLILKFTRRGKRPRIVNTILKGQNNVAGLTLLEFKTCYTATVIKTVWYR